MKMLALLLAFITPAAAKDSCAECHSGLEGALQVTVSRFAGDVHSRHGLGCASCHGGDPAADDPEVSMSRAKGFIGKPGRTAVPQFCARCHSDAAVMHKFKPQQRVDQLAQYKTSVHGRKLAAGDTAVANCVDCHSVHDIREVRDALSPVHPLRLPETCARCHADAAHMAKYKLETNQFKQYRASVHWEALAKRGDLSAPSCASCHGNHGATPPQVSSVAAVCGTCHVVFEQLYNKSPHQAAFAAMNVGSCTVCHGNHEIRRPGVGMLAGTNSVCSQCHDRESEAGRAAAQMAADIGKLEAALDRSDQLLNRARSSGMEVSEAQLRQIDGREELVKAAVAVHAFDLGAVEKPVKEGIAIAGQTLKAGEDAMRERDRRRIGLAVSLIAILVTMVGLRLAIRRLEVNQAASQGPSAGGQRI